MRTKCLIQHRAGVATLWLILMLPVVFLMLVFAVEIGNLWLARVELENSLESAALAAVKEWGDANGVGGTLVPRQVGQTFAAANTVRGVPVALNTNYDAPTALNPNGNLGVVFPTDHLVFGAVTSTSPTVVFDSRAIPSCSGGGGGGGGPAVPGKVLIDASATASLQQDDAWGFNFQPDPPNAGTVTISRVVLNLRAGATPDPDAMFNLAGLSTSTPPVISNNVAPHKILSQVDVVGISNAALVLTTVGTVRTWANAQVQFVWDSTLPHILTINFLPLGADTGFAPGDRIRFGARTLNLPQNDGDGVGVVLSTATVTFATGGVNSAPPTVATFFNSAFAGNNPPPLDPDILPNSTPYLLPNAPGNGAGNDRQAYVEVMGTTSGGGGGSGSPFAVHAQARVIVNPICPSICFGPFSVQARATAWFSCTDEYPRIIRVDQFLGP